MNSVEKLKKSNWWNEHLKEGSKDVEEFAEWIKGYDQPTKNYCRKYVISKNYKSIVDCGSGLAAEYFGYKSENSAIDYTGLDSCDFLIEKNKEAGIKMIKGDLEERLPVNDNQFEVVYCKAVLEHLRTPYIALKEFIRAAEKEVLIGWFIKPDDKPSEINYWEEENLYHNKYNKKEIEDFLRSQPKVKDFKWHNINKRENVLHIYMK
jgi:ubiquinone/menaquinone biosynthesis C-methylase UbiE